MTVKGVAAGRLPALPQVTLIPSKLRFGPYAFGPPVTEPSCAGKTGAAD